VINWLLRKNPDEVIPDGAMIVKEQYTAPAAQYSLQPPTAPRGWTIMIKDAKGSKDGWYWASFGARNAWITTISFRCSLCGLRTLLSALPLLG